MDKILEEMKSLGYETAEDALSALNALKAAKEGAENQNKEQYDKAIADVVDKAVDQAMASMQSERKESLGALAEGEAVDTEVDQLKIDVWLLSAMLNTHPKMLNAEKMKSGYEIHHGINFKAASIKKALDSADAAVILDKRAESTLLRDVEKASGVFANLRSMDMPTNPWEPPYQSSNITLYGVDENTADAGDVVGAADPGVNKITFTAKKIGARSLWSRELDEDSAIAILPIVREDFIRATRNGWEVNMLMGDERTTTSNINKYGVAPIVTAGAKDAFLQTDGMVKWASITNTAQKSDVNAVMSAAKWVGIMKLMGKYADARGDLIAFVTRDLMYDMLQLTEVMTLEKYGAKATVLTGELGKYFGVPLIITDGLPATDANGRVDGSTATNNTKKSCLIVNRAVGATIGRRGELRISVDEINRTDQYEGIVYSRYDIGFPFVKGLAYGYNIT